MSSSEGELDESTLSPEQARDGRKAARAKFTRLCTAISNAIASSKAVAALELQRETLTELFEECNRMHALCSTAVLSGPDGPEKDKANKWPKDLENIYAQVFQSIHDYVTEKNAAAEKQKEDQIAADARIAQELQDAQTEAANARATAANASAMAAAATKDHAASLLVINQQREALKRKHAQEDEEIAKKRSAEDAARAAARASMEASATRGSGSDAPGQQTESNTLAPMSSTPNRHVNFLSEFSLIDPQSSFRRYDTTGSGGSDATTIPNTIDAWIFQPFEPVVQATGAGDAMISMTLLAKANTFGGEARDWPMFIQTVKSMIHDVFPTDVQRLTMLSTMLAPPIRVGMSQIFNTPQAYRSALQELHRKYGHPHLVVRSYIRHLMSISVCDGGDGLETFSTQLNGAVATLDASGYGHELESSVALESLAAKLPGHLITRWGRNVTRLFPRVPTLRDLNSWLSIELMGMKNVQGVSQSTPAAATGVSTSQVGVNKAVRNGIAEGTIPRFAPHRASKQTYQQTCCRQSMQSQWTKSA